MVFPVGARPQMKHRPRGRRLCSITGFRVTTTVFILPALLCAGASCAEEGNRFTDREETALLRLGTAGDMEFIDTEVVANFKGPYPLSDESILGTRFLWNGQCVGFLDFDQRVFCVKGEIEQNHPSGFPRGAAYAYEFCGSSGQRLAVVDADGNLRMTGTLYVDGMPLLPIPPMAPVSDTMGEPQRAIPIDPQIVAFPDGRLEWAVRQAIGKPVGALTAADVQSPSFTRLRAVGCGIADLSGIEKCSALKTIEFDYNSIADISPLLSLPGLRCLSLNANAIEDIGGIEMLKALEWLGLSRNRVSDIAPAAGLANLRVLNLERNGVSDVSPLETMESLEVLFLGHNKVTDIEPLQRLADLQWLQLSNNKVAVLKPLGKLRNLIGLSCDSNTIEDVSPLAGLTGLRFLSLSHNLIDDLDVLGPLTALEELRVDGNSLWTLSGVRNLRALRLVSVSSNPLLDANPLVTLPELRVAHLYDTLLLSTDGFRTFRNCARLNLRNTPVTSVKSLMNVTSLRYLELAGDRMTEYDAAVVIPALRGRGVEVVWEGAVAADSADTGTQGESSRPAQAPRSQAGIPKDSARSPAAVVPDAALAAAFRENLGRGVGEPITEADLDSLKVLEAVSRGIRDLRGIDLCRNLEELHLTDNRIADLTPLSGFRRLKYLYLSSNWIDDIKLLTDITSLEGLFLDHNNIAHIDGIENLRNLHKLDLGYNHIMFIQPLASLAQLEYLGLARNFIQSIAPLQGMTRLKWLVLASNRFGDVRPLMNNIGIGRHTTIDLRGNELAPNMVAEKDGVREWAIYIRGARLLLSEFTRLNIGQYAPNGATFDKQNMDPVELEFTFPGHLSLEFPHCGKSMIIAEKQEIEIQETPYSSRMYAKVKTLWPCNYFVPCSAVPVSENSRVGFLLWYTEPPSPIRHSPHSLAHLYAYRECNNMVIRAFAPLGYVEIQHDHSDLGGDVVTELSVGAEVALSAREGTVTRTVILGPLNFEVTLRAIPRKGRKLARWIADYGGVQQSLWAQTAKIRWTCEFGDEPLVIRPEFVPEDEELPPLHEVTCAPASAGFIQMAACATEDIEAVIREARRPKRYCLAVWMTNTCMVPEGGAALINCLPPTGYGSKGWAGFPYPHGDYSEDCQPAAKGQGSITTGCTCLIRKNVNEAAHFQAVSKPAVRVTLVNRIPEPTEGPGHMEIMRPSYYVLHESGHDDIGNIVMEVGDAVHNEDGTFAIPMIIRRTDQAP